MMEALCTRLQQQHVLCSRQLVKPATLLLLLLLPVVVVLVLVWVCVQQWGVLAKQLAAVVMLKLVPPVGTLRPQQELLHPLQQQQRQPLWHLLPHPLLLVATEQTLLLLLLILVMWHTCSSRQVLLVQQQVHFRRPHARSRSSSRCQGLQ